MPTRTPRDLFVEKEAPLFYGIDVRRTVPAFDSPGAAT